MRRIKQYILAFIFAVALSYTNTFAAETVKNVSVKIEGDNSTLVNQSNMSIKNTDLSTIVGGGTTESWTKDAVALHAVVEAISRSGKNPADTNVLNSNGGTYISSILGLSGNNNGGWMFVVNNEFAGNDGISQYILKDNDKITVYYLSDFYTQNYGYFNSDIYNAKEMHNFSLNLFSKAWGDKGIPVVDAKITILNTKTNKYVNNNYTSDKNGMFNIKLAAGQYQIAAKSKDNTITRASTIVNVTKDSTSTNTNQNNPKPLPKTKNYKKGNTTYYQKLVGKKYYTTKSIYKKGSVKTTQYYKLIKSKNRLIKKETYIKYKKKNVRTYYNSISYYANGRVKVNTKLHKDKKTNKYTKKYKTTYRSNGKKSKYVKITYKKGKTSKRSEYVYNKKGQLKSNKYGKSYRYITKYSKKGKATRTVRKQYNKKGKLTNNKKVKIRKSF